MKLTALPALLVLFTLPQIPGCDTGKISETLKQVTYENADSILTKSQSNIVVLGRASEKSDSVIAQKVAGTIDKIEDLSHEIKVLKPHTVVIFGATAAKSLLNISGKMGELAGKKV